MDELDSRAVNDRTDLVCDPAGSVPDPGLILAKTILSLNEATEA